MATASLLARWVKHTALALTAYPHQPRLVKNVRADNTPPLLQRRRLTATELGALNIPYHSPPPSMPPRLTALAVVAAHWLGPDRLAPTQHVAHPHVTSLVACPAH